MTDGTWLRHVKLGDGQTRNEAQEHKKVLDSWKGAFSYVVEDTAAGVIGLRPPQIGAVHAVHAYWSVADTPATVVGLEIANSGADSRIGQRCVPRGV